MKFPDWIDPKLKAKCFRAWQTNAYETVISSALKLLESRIADAVGGGYGSKLLKKAFTHQAGILKFSKDEREQEGIYETYSGIFKWLRNPSAHEFVPYTKKEAAEILCFVDFLLERLDRYTEKGLAEKVKKLFPFSTYLHAYKIADVDGDSQKEAVVVVCEPNDYPESISHLVVLKQTKDGLKQYKLHEKDVGVFKFLDLKDVNNDGQLEILLSYAYYPNWFSPATIHLAIFSWDGTQFKEIDQFVSQRYVQGATYTPIEIIDCDSDGKWEIITREPSDWAHHNVRIFHWKDNGYHPWKRYRDGAY